jgi:hypothetical protein
VTLGSGGFFDGDGHRVKRDGHAQTHDLDGSICMPGRLESLHPSRNRYSGKHRLAPQCDISGGKRRQTRVGIVAIVRKSEGAMLGLDHRAAPAPARGKACPLQPPLLQGGNTNRTDTHHSDTIV